MPCRPTFRHSTPSSTKIRRALPGIAKLAESPREKGRPVVNNLALSSGGDDGAFAAGVLVGWTRSGRRPRFEIVTGVSSGALIAPFAFLGPAYDKDLESIWTGHAGADLVTPQPLAVLLGGNALADTQPLAQLIPQYVNRRLLQAIAREYRGAVAPRRDDQPRRATPRSLEYGRNRAKSRP